MRYYDIKITSPAGKLWVPQGFQSLGLTSSFTSYVGGKTLAAALNVEIDAPVTNFADPRNDQGGAYVRVWGIGLQDIAQANNLSGYNVVVQAGMQKGLPLANPSQAGVIISGYIFQPFGNWIGLDQTLDLIVYAGVSPGPTPPNIIHKWTKGTQLSSAIQQTLATAYPGITPNINISPDLVLDQDDVGFYNNLEEYAQYVRSASIAIKGKSYPGVSITINQNTFNVFDGTSAKTPIPIAFQDLIGQPTWIESPNIQFKTVMRADLHVGDTVQLPTKAIFTTTQQSLSQFRQNSAFSGIVTIKSIHHYGNFRQADAASWASVYEAYPQTVS
jgi:hypothetical protein